MKANSRVWMGVHWDFDATYGNQLGEEVGNTVYNSILQPD
jgi:hypothetical protein